MTDATEVQRAFQDIGDAICAVFDQMERGNWQDDHGHPVRNNMAMLRLKDVLAAMIAFRKANPSLLKEETSDD